jgi:hypothetical protein
VEKKEAPDWSRKGRQVLFPKHASRDGQLSEHDIKMAKSGDEIRAVLDPFGDDPLAVVREFCGIEAVGTSETEERGRRPTLGVVSLGA